jgi:disease resistance protein RPM1
MAEIAVSASLVLAEVAIHFLRDLKHQHFREEIEKLHTKLRMMIAFLRDMDGSEINHRQREKVLEVRDVAYDIEDILDEYMRYEQYQLHPYKFARAAYKFKQYCKEYRHISSMIDAAQLKIQNIEELGSCQPAEYPHDGLTSSGSRAQLAEMHGAFDDDDIVGFKDPLRELRHHLVYGKQPRLVTISVVGGGGSGKTVLVRSIYMNKEIRRRFDCCAWVHVTHASDAAVLLDNVLQNLCSSEEKQINRSQQGSDVWETLRNYLQTRKYLVVLDGVWSDVQWTSIETAFPKNSPGSRIIVTTRNMTVASTCVESYHFILKLAALSRPDAWGLFCKKAFGKTNRGECHDTVKVWAEKIFRKCETPLEIVVVAGLLSHKPLHEREWKILHNDLGSTIRDHSVLSSILVPSYKDLNSSLKKCLLYFSNFPEDHQIGCRILCRLWVAERFAVGSSTITAEEVARNHLKELIQRNMVSVVRSDFDGKERWCRVPKLVLEFILKKTEEENFAHVPAKEGIFSKERVRRLSIHDKPLSVLEKIVDLSRIRSLFWFNLNPSSVETNLLSKFTYMRVLDMRGVALDEFPQGIFFLTLLRYLSLRDTGVKDVPNAIKKLTYLETLDLKGTKVTKLPPKIERLIYLRHLFVYSYNVSQSVAFDSVIGVEVPNGIGALINLQKLSIIHLDKHGKIIKALEKLTQLRKLSVLSLKREDGANFCNTIRKMENLATLDVSSTAKDEYLDLDRMTEHPNLLENLHLKGRLKKVPQWIPRLNSLSRISLMWSRLEYDPLEYFQDLYNLVQLEMVDAYCLPKLVFKAGFKKLTILYIGQFDELEEVIIGEGAIPELRKLGLTKCKKMKTLPSGINNLAFVETLNCVGMPDEFIAHVKSDEGQEMISHIPVIHSYTFSETDNEWLFENLS